jgi:hypothetical protein
MYCLYLGLGVQNFFMCFDCEYACKLYWQYCKSEIKKYFDVCNLNVMYDKLSVCVDYECAYRLCMEILYIVCRHIHI